MKVVPHGLGDLLALHFQLQREGEATRDINLRKALSFSINREDINKFLVGGQGRVTGNIFTGLEGMATLEVDSFDLAKAKDFLSKTPYGPGGTPLNLHIQSQIREGWPQMINIAETVQASWAKIGIASTITYRDYGSFRTEWAAGKLPAPAVVVTNLSGSPDYTGLAGGVFGCKGVITSACDPEFDKLVSSWVSSTSPEQYTSLAMRAEKYLRDNYWVVPILAAGILFAGNTQIHRDYTPGLVHRGINTRALVWNP
jgi:dipeptide transport system substrate-binding protein